jgi:hypothetical protein
MGAEPAAEQQPRDGQEEGEPNQEGRAVRGKEQDDAEEGFGGGAVAGDERIVETRGDCG